MVNVIVFFDLHMGKRDEFLEEFRKIVPLVNAEDGCIEYGATIDVDMGDSKISPPRHDHITVLEKWESIDALKAHVTASHMLEYRPKVKPLIVKSQVFVTEPI